MKNVWIWFFAGIVCVPIHVFGPLHELGHVLVGGGRITGWTTSVMESPDVSGYSAGYLTEALVFGAGALFCLGRRFGWFCFGYYNLVVWWAMMSQDFETIRETYQETINTGWICLNILPLVILWVFYLKAEMALQRNRKGKSGK